MSVGGIGGNRKQFGALLPYVDHLPHTLDLARNAFSQGLPDARGGPGRRAGGAGRAARRRDHRRRDGGAGRGLDRRAAAARGYLQRLRDICTKHGILLIFDEVITGFGRMGPISAPSGWAWCRTS